MNTRFGAFTLRVDCPRCGQPVPLNGPTERGHCAACAGDFPVPTPVISELLLDFDDAHPSMSEGQEIADARLVAGMQIHATKRRAAPSCEKCGGPLPRFEGDAPPKVHCPTCGDAAAIFPAPAWLKEIVPTAVRVVTSDATAAPGGGPAVPAPDASRPIVMPCPQCGGSLRLTGETERVVPCTYCKSDVYLPDDLWRRLHPTKTLAPWFIHFEGESRAELARRATEQANAERAANASAAAAARAEENRRRIAQHDADQLEAAQELDADVERLKLAAYPWAAALVALFAAGTVWGVAAGAFHSLRKSASAVGVTLVAASLVCLIIATAMASRPIQRRTKYDGAAMMFVAWFFLIFGVVMPVAGQVMMFVVGIKRFMGTLGGNTIETNGSSKYYPPIQLSRGEGYPLGIVYMAMAFLRPAMILTLGKYAF